MNVEVRGEDSGRRAEARGAGVGRGVQVPFLLLVRKELPDWPCGGGSAPTLFLADRCRGSRLRLSFQSTGN